MANIPNVSVCMAVYNGEKYIREQIESVLSQLQENDELLVFDDLSTDATASIVAELAIDGRIKYKKNKDRMGVVCNFEQALCEAKGEYIFLCDQDDIWLPTKVQVCVDELQKHLLVVTDCVVVNERVEVLHPSFFELRHSGSGVLKNLWKNTYLGCCMAFRRELLHICLPIPKSMPMHDMWLGLTADASGDVLFIDKKLSLYRRHQFVASYTAGNSQFNIFQQINFRLVLACGLVVRLLRTQYVGYTSIKS